MLEKKVLFIITKSEMGGAQRFLYEFITHLNPQNYQFLVAASGNGQLIEKLREKEIEVASIKNFSNTPGLKNFLAFLEVFKLIRNFKPDILYLLSSEAGFIGAIAGKLYRLLFWRKKPKIIYRIGGWAFKEPRNIFIKKIYLWAEKISAPFKDIIITNSEFDKRLAIKNKIVEPDKIITIYNGLDVDNLKFLSKEEAKIFIESKIPAFAKASAGRQTTKYKIQNTILIGTIANLYKNKGLEYLILAIARIKGNLIVSSPMPTFIIIGKGPERKNIENLIKKYELENIVYLAGSIPDAYKYLKAFDLFVLPSVKEGQPWTILEAMAAEIPIVATNVAGIPEMIENEKSGLLVEPADPKALSLVIKKMLVHPSLEQECVKNALTAVKEKFGTSEMVRKNEEFFY